MSGRPEDPRSAQARVRRAVANNLSGLTEDRVQG